MFVRVKSSPNSPRRSVQVVESLRAGDRVSQRIVRHMGIALDAQEEAKLRAMGQEFIERALAERLNADSLFAVESVQRAPGPDRHPNSPTNRHVNSPTLTTGP